MKLLFAPALAAVLFFYGCAGRTVHSPADIPQPADPAAYLAAVRRESGGVKDVSGFAKLRLETRHTSTTSRNVFFVKRPGLLRIDTLGFLSRPALIFTADPLTMKLYDVGGNIVFAGPTTPENFTRIIGLPLALDEILETFFGLPPLQNLPGQTVDCTVRQGQFVFTVSCGNVTEQLSVDPRMRRISRYELFENGAPVYRCSFSRFHTVERTVFPLKIEIYHYTYNTAVTLELESLSLAPIPRGRFELPAPHTVKVQPFEALDATP